MLVGCTGLWILVIILLVRTVELSPRDVCDRSGGIGNSEFVGSKLTRFGRRLRLGERSEGGQSVVAMVVYQLLPSKRAFNPLLVPLRSRSVPLLNNRGDFSDNVGETQRPLAGKLEDLLCCVGLVAHSVGVVRVR